MEIKKKVILFFLIVLSGCSRQNEIACSLYDNEDTLTLKIFAQNDDIRMIEVVESFKLPEKLLADRKHFDDLSRQFDSSCHMEGNMLIRNYSLLLDGRYSFKATIDDLKARRYNCE